jgi:hypothetical protein
MTTPLDHDRSIAAWLVAEAPERAPERLLAASRDRIRTTRQRRAWWPARRIPEMNTFAKFAIAAVAVVVVALAGITLLPRDGGIGTQPSPTASQSPSASPSPSPTYTWPSTLQPATYTTQLVWDVPVEVTFTVPALGWQGMDVEVRKDPNAMVGFLVVDNLFADPCTAEPLAPKLGPSVDDLAQALTRLPGVTASTPQPVTHSGFSGSYLELTFQSDAPCPLSDYALFRVPPDAMQPGSVNGGTDWGASYPNHRVWVLDVDGVRYVIDAVSTSSPPADVADELQLLVDSIRVAVAT